MKYCEANEMESFNYPVHLTLTILSGQAWTVLYQNIAALLKQCFKTCENNEIPGIFQGRRRHFKKKEIQREKSRKDFPIGRR